MTEPEIAIQPRSVLPMPVVLDGRTLPPSNAPLSFHTFGRVPDPIYITHVIQTGINQRLGMLLLYEIIIAAAGLITLMVLPRYVIMC